jgi:hypothetical protein
VSTLLVLAPVIVVGVGSTPGPCHSKVGVPFRLPYRSKSQKSLYSSPTVPKPKPKGSTWIITASVDKHKNYNYRELPCHKLSHVAMWLIYHT